MSMIKELENADSYVETAKKAKERADLPGAKKYYRAALEIYESEAEKARTIQIMKKLRDVYMELSCTEQGMHNIADAMMWGKKYLNIANELYELVPSEEMHLNAAYALQNFGDIYILRKNFNRAAKYYLKCLTIYEDIANKTAWLEAYRDIASVNGVLGMIYTGLKDRKTSEEYFEKGINAWSYAAEQSGYVEDIQKLACMYYNSAVSQLEWNDHQKARDAYLKSADHYISAAEETNDPYFFQMAGTSYMEAAKAAKSQNDTEGAEELKRKAEEIYNSRRR